MSTSYEAFAAVTPGLEEALSAELASLVEGARLQRRQGGVSFRCSQEALWRVAHMSRLAETLRVRIGRFHAPSFPKLEAGLARVPWSAYLAREAKVDLQVSARKSALYHSGAISERVGRALKRELTRPEEADVRLWIRIVKDHVTLSVDAGGGLLHRRGWRLAVGRAPMRETLAAACVQLAGVEDTQALWDPFCGSGTIPIEAALRRRGAPAQNERRFAFAAWPTFQREAYDAWLEPIDTPRAVDALFYASEHSEDTLRGARENATRAQVGDVCHWLSGDFAEHSDQVPHGAAIVSNLPYGKRLSTRDSNHSLFKRFGKLLASRQDLGPVVVLSGATHFAQATGLKWEAIARFKNRGTQTALLRLKR